MELAPVHGESWQSFLSQLSKNNPILAEHLRCWQNASLADYSNYIWNGAGRQHSHQVSPRFLKVIDTLGLANSEVLKSTLTRSPVVLSAHHTAPALHPIAWQTLLVANAARNKQHLIPVLSSDWIPMDNLFYPRGLLLPSAHGLRKFNIFPKSCNKKCVSEMTAYTRKDIDKLRLELDCAATKKEITERHREMYISLIDEYFCLDSIFEQKSYKQQSSQINLHLCRDAFPDQRFEFINISEIAITLLIDVLQDTSSLLHNILFNKELCRCFVSLLDGESGCWNIAKGRGSILFWQLQSQKMYPLLGFNGNTLFNDVYSQHLSASELVLALREKRVIPGMAVVFVLLMFECGLACVGGMRQIAYNSAVKHAMEKVVTRYMPEYLDSLDVPVDFFAAGMYASVDRALKPTTVIETLFQPEKINTDYVNVSVQDAVLLARETILSLSG